RPCELVRILNEIKTEGGDSNPYRRRTSDPTQVPYNPCAARVFGVLSRSPRHPETTLKNPDLPPKSRTGPAWSRSAANCSIHTWRQSFLQVPQASFPREAPCRVPCRDNKESTPRHEPRSRRDGWIRRSGSRRPSSCCSAR